MRYRWNLIGRLLCGASLMGSCQAAFAQDPQIAEQALPEETAAMDIVVTAQKRSENLQDVPIAITTLSGDQLAKKQIRAADDLVTAVPSLQVNGVLGEGVPIFSLRGISMSDFSLAQNGPIAVYYDEVYKGNPAILGLGVFDLERVEALKGPQGTLYGKNTTGGAVNLIARKPEFRDEAMLTLGYGNYDHFMADGAVETALSDHVGGRFAFTFDRAHGWADNLSPGAPDAHAIRQYGLRGSLRFQNDTVDLVIRGSTSLQNPWNYGVIAVPGPMGVGAGIYADSGFEFRQGLGRRQVDAPDMTRRRLRTYALAANADITMSDDLTLTSITSWDRGTMFYNEDGEGTRLNVSRATYFGRTTQFAQDLRLTSDFKGPFNFIVGTYFSDEKIFNSTSIDFFYDLDLNEDGNIDAADCELGGFFLACNVLNAFDQKKQSIALYSDATYEFNDNFTLRGGLRYTHDRGKLRNFLAQIRDLDGNPLINTIPGSATDLDATMSSDFSGNNLSGKIGLDYKPNNDVLLYLSYSRGYRGAAFSGQAFFSPMELTVAKPETVDAIEGGFKTDLFDRLVRFNGSFYWYGYKNQQFINVDPLTTANSLINLPKSRFIGAEFDLQIRPTRNLTLSTAIGVLDSKVREGMASGVDVAGNHLIGAPVFTLSSSIDWTVPLGGGVVADAHADLAHASGQFFDILNRPTTHADGYTLLNARLRLHPEDDRYGIGFWVKNLTNEFYYTSMIDASGVGFTYTHVNAPRTFGVTVDAKF